MEEKKTVIQDDSEKTLTKRQKARAEVFQLLFERDFQKEKSAEDVYRDALSARTFAEDPYILSTFLGTVAHEEEILAEIDRHAVGWKRNRISAVSLNAMKLCIYEMRYTEIPLRVALNEALLLVKRFDDEKARPFVNGVLNAVLQELLPTRGDK